MPEFGVEIFEDIFEHLVTFLMEYLGGWIETIFQEVGVNQK
jgi:hypothetical protein